MTYEELLNQTKKEKESLQNMIYKASKDNFTYALCKNDIEKVPHMLARFFFEKLCDNIGGILKSVGEEDKIYLSGLYMKYCDIKSGDTEAEISFDELPDEARL